MRPSSILKFAVLAALAIGLSAAGETPRTSGAPPAARQCFWSHDVHNFAYSPPDKVNIRVGVRDVYELTLFGECGDIDQANFLRFDTHGFSSICSGLDLDLIVPTTLGPRRCAVRSLRRLTSEEIAALPRRARP